MPKRKQNHKNRFKKILMILAIVLFSIMAYFSVGISFLLKTSTIGLPEHAPFDGTVYPIQKVPNWSHYDQAKKGLSYASFTESELISLPYYEPSQLSVPADSLKWGDSQSDTTRNAKITYPVPYLGTYLLDGKENTGSHPAVDIKIPEGTPVFAIANGVVIKASNDTSGFGKHIVIQHNNFPSLEDPNAKTVLYSSYNHCSSLLISAGTVVTKGQQIALSGATGTATTPHLHFQIDNENAPWHPYWPFTWQELNDAKLDFFSGINAGLGKDKAAATTINPMKYVQTYLNVVSATSNVDTTATTTTTTTDSTTTPNTDIVANNGSTDGPVADSNVETVNNDTVNTETPAVTIETPVVDVVVKDPAVLTFKFEVKPQYNIGENSEFSIFLKDQYDEIFKDGFTGAVAISSENGFVNLSTFATDITGFDSEGKLSGTFTKMDAGKDRLKLDYQGNTYYSDYFEIIDPTKVISFSDLPETDKYHEAVTYLVSKEVVNGYPDGTFRPNNVVSRVEALKFIFEGIKETLSSGAIPFPDVSIEQWYGKYLYTAYEKGVVNGYPDGTFKPTNTVNRAEFYKILFNGMGADVNPVVTVAPFEDVKTTDWFAPFVSYAKDFGIIEPGITQLKPSEGMTRGEVAYAIYRMMEAAK